MMKHFLFLCFSLLMTQTLWARSPLIMTHENFVHLTSDEKEKVIIQTMELIVELESQYQFEQIKQVENSETLNKLIKLYSFLNNVLISSAHAQSANPNKTWEQNGNNFISLMESPERCIYGGWVSTIVNGICVHPSTAQKKVKGKWIPDSAVRDAYKNTATGGCEKPGLTKIACNPVIFGYDNLKSSRPFCVNAGLGPAHNSAYECMKAATKSEENIKFLKDKLSGNASITNGVHKFVTKACLCEGEAKNINSKYHSYMRPHRTCFGLMNTIADTYGQCSVVEDKAVFETFKDIHKSISKDIITNNSRVNESDLAYKSFLEDKYSKDDIANFCGVDPKPKANTEDDPKPEKDPTPGNVCKCTKIKDSTKLSCVATILIDGKEPHKETFELSQDQEHEFDLSLIKDLKLTGKLACTMDEEEDNAIQCTEMKFEAKDGKISATAVYELKDIKVKEGAKPVWSPAPLTSDDKTASFDVPKEGPLSASLTLELDQGKTLECKGEWSKDPKGDDGKNKPTIAASKESETTANVVAKATITVTKEGKPETVDKVDGYTIVWYRKGAKALDLPKVDLKPKEEKKGGMKGVATDGEEAKVVPEKTPEEIKAEEDAKKREKENIEADKIKIAEGTPTVTAPRSAKGDYEVCAELQGKGEVIAGGCVKVPKIQAPQQRGNGMQQPFMPRHQTAAPLAL